VLVIAAAIAGLATAFATPGRPTLRRAPARGGPSTPTSSPTGLRSWRLPCALLAGTGAAVVLGGPAAPVAGLTVGGVTWVVAGRIEPRSVRLRREEVRRDLPHVVTLFAAALRSGAAPGAAIELVARALPGAAADQLAPVAARLALGGDPLVVWSTLANDPAIGPLGRTMGRAHRSGAPIVAAVERLSEELARRSRADVEDRARTVGVRAAVPLGVCLLPAFLLLGIVPLVAGLAREIAW